MNKSRLFKCLAIVAFSATMATTASAQEPTKQDYKVAKKEAKEKKKEGWRINPGDLSLVEQIARSNCIIRNKAIWLTGLGEATGSIKSVVRSQALFEAKLELVKAIIQAAGVENWGGNKEDVMTLIDFKEENKAIYANEIKHPDIITDCYKDETNGNVTVLIRIALTKEDSMKSYEKMNKLYKDLMNK